MEIASASLKDLLAEIERTWLVSELPQRADLCREALSRSSRGKDRRLWAVLQAELARSLVLSPGCDQRGEKEAVAAFRKALAAWPRGERIERAEVEIDLALAYAERRGGDPGENIEKGLRCIRRALRLITSETAPLLWARSLSARGDLLAQRRTGASSRHWNRTIAAYRQALQIQSPETTPREWIPTMLGLGNALRARAQEAHAEDLEEAILTYRRLLAVCDPADQNRPSAQMNLGVALHERLRGKPAENLEQAIAAYRLVLAAWRRRDHPREWARVRVNLANALVDQYQLGEGHGLEEALGLYRDALTEIRPREAPVDVTVALCNLATALSLRGDPASREEAVMTMRQALTVVPRRREPETWATAQRLLGNRLVERDGGDRADDLEEAIAAFRRALRVWRRETSPQPWAETTIELAQALLDRARGNPARNAERAIRHLRDVLTVVRRGSEKEDWINATTLLGECLMKRGTGNRMLDFEEAIHCFRRVLRAQRAEADPDPEDLSVTLFYLADAYLSRPRGNRARNLEQAISSCRCTLNLLLPQAGSSGILAVAWQKLGNCLHDRLWGDRSTNLEEAIDCFRSALKIFSEKEMSYEWALTWSDLGNALLSRTREDRSGSHEQAIEAYEQALTVLLEESYPHDRARTLTSLGVALSERLLGEPDENLERAISAFQEALSVRRIEARRDHWTDTMLDLGAAYQDPRRKDRAQGIELAIETYRQILRLTKRRNDPLAWAEATLNLGTAYSDRVFGDPADNIERAIAAYKRALKVMTRRGHPLDWALTQFNLGEAYERRALGTEESNRCKAIEAYGAALKIHRPRTLPVECRRTASSLGELCLRTGRWRQAAFTFRIALQAAETLYRLSLLASSREIEMSSYPAIYRHAAYSMARVGRAGEALIVLERGRAREVGETLARDRADVDAIGRENPSLCQRYLQAARQLRQVERTERAVDRAAWQGLVARRGLEPLRAEARKARSQLDSVVSDIRKLPGHQDFLQPLDLPRIGAGLQPGGCLSYLNVTAAGTQIFLLIPTREGRGRWKVLWEDGFNAKNLDGLLSQWSFHAPLRTEIFPALRSLGTLVSALAREVRRRRLGQVTLIPCGPLNLFPLHAALYRHEAGETTLLDEVEVSYAPSARLLATSRKALRSFSAGAWKLVGVGSPDISDETALQFARGELSFISRLFPAEQNCLLFGQAAGREALLRNLPGATHLHLACHGRFFEEDPLSSCLLLARGEALSAREMVSDGLLACTRLAVLSACQSARTDILRLPDEAVGLPSVFLQAGIPGVVGALWPVDDVSTALLMMRFYELHLRGDGEGPLPPVRALRRAQLWLRDVRAGELLAFFREQRRLRDGGHPVLDAAAIAAGLSRFALEEPESRPFADPYHWAPFLFVGV